MAGRLSVVLRNQFEVAKRVAVSQLALAMVGELRGHVELAITIVRRQRQLVENTEPSWNLQRALLEDELDELQRLRAQVDLFIDGTSPLT